MALLKRIKKLELDYDSARKKRMVGHPQVYEQITKLENLLHKWINDTKVSNYKRWVFNKNVSFWDFINEYKKDSKKSSGLEKAVAHFEAMYSLDVMIVYHKENNTFELAFNKHHYAHYNMVLTITDDPTDGQADITALSAMHKGSNKFPQYNIPITHIHINDQSSCENILQKLLSKLDLFLPMIITYNSPYAPRHFLVSIPAYTNLTELNKNFSKQINPVHSDFFGHRKGRLPRKEYYQLIFNEHFPLLRKKGYTVVKSCVEIAKLFKQKHGWDIKWETVYRNYYQPWRKTQKSKGKSQKER